MQFNSVTQPSLKFISMKEFLKTTSIPKSTHYEKLDKRSKSYDPTYPRPVKLGARSVGYVEQEVIDWVKAKMEERN